MEVIEVTKSVNYGDSRGQAKSVNYGSKPCGGKPPQNSPVISAAAHLHYFGSVLDKKLFCRDSFPMPQDLYSEG